MKIFINTFRRIRKNTLDFSLNLIGLSIAMLVFIFVSLYVKNEISFDQYHPTNNQIFRLTTSITSPNGQATNMALANTAFVHILKNKCPEIDEIGCVDIGDHYQLKYQENKFENISIRAATSSVFKIFSYPIIEGNVGEFLKSPNTIILTESLSKQIFKQTNPIGERLIVGEDNYEVTGIIEDLPINTDLQFSALIDSDINGTEELTDWGDYFVYLKTNVEDTRELKEKIDRITTEEYQALLQQMGGFDLVHHLQPLKDVHFDNSLLADLPKGNRTTVYVFSIIAFLILIIAGINYINISMAQLQKRQKEFEIRKTLGSNRGWIIHHIISESVIIASMATVLSFSIACLLLSNFNNLFDKQFELFSIFRLFIPLCILFFIFGIISGIFPAYKSSKQNIGPNAGASFFGKSLVTFQNIISIVMIAGVILIWNQVNFMKNHNLGFNQEQLIAINLNNENQSPGMEVIRQEFSKLPEVKSLALGGGGTNLGESDNWMKAIMVTKDDQGNDIQFVLNQPDVDENYIELFGIEMIEGRNFSSSISTDTENAVIINEAYAKKMGWKEPLGKPIFEDQQQKVIGVVKDFHFEALHNPIEPLMFRMLNAQPAFLFLKAEPRHLSVIRSHWEKQIEDVPFEFSFIDKHMDELYKKDEKEMSIFSYLAIIALLISCLGLYGLAYHFIIDRTKEIGIRKVNGAKVSEILAMLNKDFVKWVVIAFVIAIPIAYYAMNKWLENFAYKTNLSWWIFALAGMLALGIALLTVSWQSWRAATRNPVEALRYE